jgi:hypothetical protein
MDLQKLADDNDSVALLQTHGRYNFGQLLAVTQQYAKLKGYTETASDKAVATSKVLRWLDSRMSITGAAIEWFESTYQSCQDPNEKLNIIVGS